DMVMPTRLAARRNLPEDHLEAGAELAPDEPPVDRPGMRRRRVARQLGDVLDQLAAQPGIRHLRPPIPCREPPLRSATVVHTTYPVMGMTSRQRRTMRQRTFNPRRLICESTRSARPLVRSERADEDHRNAGNADAKS